MSETEHIVLSYCTSRGKEFWLVARSEEGEYPQRYLTDKRQRQEPKELPPLGLPAESPSGGVAPHSQTAEGMLIRRALPYGLSADNDMRNNLR